MFLLDTIVFVSESRLCEIPCLILVFLPEFVASCIHEACVNRIQVIWPTSCAKYRLLVITVVAFMRSLADYFLAPVGAVPRQWGYFS
jgi:hypothetical protein